MGRVLQLVTYDEHDEALERGLKVLEEEEEFRKSLDESSTLWFLKLGQYYDDLFLDPIVGAVMPGFGDLLSSAVTFPALYVASCKLKSFKLTVVVLFYMFLDFVVGAVPILGDIFDACHKSNKKSRKLIVAYSKQDPEAIRKVNSRFAIAICGIAILAFATWKLIGWLMELAEKAGSFFGGIGDQISSFF